MMQTEVGEVSEPYQDGRGGSSTMPQKRNPIASEYILGATRAVHALVPVMLGSMIADHERATGPWQSESLALPQCVALTAGALAHARSIAEGMTVDPERMRRNLELTGGLIMSEAIATALVQSMVRKSLDSFVTRDAELARSVLSSDDAVDDLRNANFHELISFMEQDPRNIRQSVDLLSVVRNLERIADHATNIAEDVLFLAKGVDVRHHAETRT